MKSLNADNHRDMLDRTYWTNRLIEEKLMKVTKTQALKAINGATADEVYNALDFSQLPC